MCNYNCIYCYARNLDYFGQKWLKIPNMEQQKSVVDAISKSHLPFNLGLLGGEPTLYPRFHQLLDYIFEKCSRNEAYSTENQIYLVTNGSKSREWFEKLPQNSNFSVLFSYHPEFCKNSEILESIKSTLNRGIKSKVNIMLHPSQKIWPKIEEFYKECSKIKNLKMHPHFLYKQSDKYLWDYSEDFWVWAKNNFGEFERDIAFEELIGDETRHHLFNDFEVYSKGINRFNGFNCMNNNYEINIDGSVTIFCKNERYDLIKNQDYFSNITKINPMKCEYDMCNCDGLLKIFKYKEKI